MTYVACLALFFVVPLAVLAGLLRRRLLDRRFLAVAGALPLISPLYMVPRVHAADVSRLWSWSVH